MPYFQTEMTKSAFELKAGLAQMLKGGVIMDVVNVEQAKIAEEAGACAVMALERVPSDIRKEGGVSRMSDPKFIQEIMEAVSIPVMAKCRIGHITEARVLQSLGVDYIDESEVLTPADQQDHIEKNEYDVPFVCGARDLGEALRRINEGAAMLRTKGEAGTGDISQAVAHIKQIQKEAQQVLKLSGTKELQEKADELRIPVSLLKQFIADKGKFPVVNFAAGGVATPSDAALCMTLGSEGVFVGSGIFKSEDPAKMARAIVSAVTNYKDPTKVLEASKGLGKCMPGASASSLKPEERLSTRGW